MKEDIAISADHIAKKYRLFSSPSDRLKEALHPFRKRYHSEFWALKGVSFQIPKGQTVGILGRNGSGKSTLLQIVSSVLQPTSGTLAVRGKVAALLELGAGFNPEFTGRDNVILNGVIMGISRVEMQERMPSIEEFAGIGDFIDQPVKTYSSGMFVRLAFSTAIHVDPDILVVDEALGVGDAKFQHKCFKRFSEFQQSGKTIVFVTHSVSLVNNHCDRALLLENGELVGDGTPHKIVDEYMRVLFGKYTPSIGSGNIVSSNSADISSNPSALPPIFSNANSDSCYGRRGYNVNETRFGNRDAEILDFAVGVDESIDNNIWEIGAEVHLFMKVKFHTQSKAPIIGFAIKTVDGLEVYGSNTYLLGIDIDSVVVGETRIFRFSFENRLASGDYFIDLGVASVDGTPGGEIIDVRRSAIHLTVVCDSQRFNGFADLKPKFLELHRSEFSEIGV